MHPELDRDPMNLQVIRRNPDPVWVDVVAVLVILVVGVALAPLLVSEFSSWDITKQWPHSSYWYQTWLILRCVLDVLLVLFEASLIGLFFAGCRAATQPR